MPEDLAVTVLVFAALRDRLGADRCHVRAAAGTVPAGLWPLLPEPLRRDAPPAGVRYAVNDVWATDPTPLADGDRVAIILPVSGG